MSTIHAGKPDLLEQLRQECVAWEASPMQCVLLLREGLTWVAFRRMALALGLSDATAAGILRIPPRTLSRRKAGRLELNEGERVMRLIRLATRAIDVLGSPEKANHWLEAPNGALEGATPLSLLDTDVGTQAAEDVLGRIEYGVFS